MSKKTELTNSQRLAIKLAQADPFGRLRVYECGRWSGLTVEVHPQWGGPIGETVPTVTILALLRRNVLLPVCSCPATVQLRKELM